jgi:predicted methyltransferase
MPHLHLRAIGAVALALLLGAGLAAYAQQHSLDASILDDPTRSEDDRYRDQGFKPLEVYGFFGVTPGMTVADLWTSRGYNAHVLAHVVGDSGKLYAVVAPFESSPERTERSRQALSERFGAAGLNNVEIVADLAALPADSLDVLVTVRNYHDLGEREARLEALPHLMRVLKPGGILGVVDAHTDVAGERDESVHRINEDLARAEITSGGFEFVGASDVLYNAEDTFDFDGRERAGVRGATEDAPIHRYFIQRWVHKYRKPLN